MSEEKTVLDEIRERVERSYAQGFKDATERISELEKAMKDTTSEFSECLKRDKELEKKLDHLEEYYIEEGIGERIEKLEQELTTFQTKYPYTTAFDNSRELAELKTFLEEYIEGDKIWLEQLQDNKKEIDELKKKYLGTIPVRQSFQKQINELKEQLENYGLDLLIGISKNEEVLRELGNRLDNKILLIYQGKSPTEADIMLGGEKSEEVNNPMSSRSGMKTSEDSKPPKGKWKAVKKYRLSDEFKELLNKGTDTKPPEHDPANIDYCEAFDGKDTIEVSREDLERIIHRLEHFLDVNRRGSFPMPSVYVEWDNDLFNDKEKYLGEGK